MSILSHHDEFEDLYKKACEHCCGGDNPKWTWDEIPFDMGIFGKAQITLAITNRGAEIQLEGTGAEECIYIYERLSFKYCPYCGRKLGGDFSALPH